MLKIEQKFMVKMTEESGLWTVKHRDYIALNNIKTAFEIPKVRIKTLRTQVSESRLEEKKESLEEEDLRS